MDRVCLDGLYIARVGVGERQPGTAPSSSTAVRHFGFADRLLRSIHQDLGELQGAGQGNGPGDPEGGAEGGALEEDDQIVLADFQAPDDDPDLGTAVSRALRIDLLCRDRLCGHVNGGLPDPDQLANRPSPRQDMMRRTLPYEPITP